MSSEAFERHANRYEACFEKSEASAIFGAQAACLGQLMPADVRPVMPAEEIPCIPPRTLCTSGHRRLP